MLGLVGPIMVVGKEKDKSTARQVASADSKSSKLKPAAKKKKSKKARRGRRMSNDIDDSIPEADFVINRPSMDPQVLRMNSEPSSQSFDFVSKFETLNLLLKKHKFSIPEIQEIRANPLLPEDFRLEQNGVLQISKYPNNGGVDIKVFDYSTNDAFVFWRSNGYVGLKIVPSELETRTKTYSGKITKSLAGSVFAACGDFRVAQQVLNAYVLNFDTNKLGEKGAEFGFTVEEQYYKGRFIKHGEVLWTMVEINGEPVEREYVKFNRGGAFVSLDEELAMDLEDKPMYSPLHYIRVTSHFNPRRFHPFRRRTIPHNGVDLGLAKGESVYASQSGVITKTGRTRGGGNGISIAHENGFETFYEHLNKIEPGIEPGVMVVAGQKIAEVGCTGYCTSPHLHFGLKKDGVFVNPVFYIKPFPAADFERVQTYVASRRLNPKPIGEIDRNTASKAPHAEDKTAEQLGLSVGESSDLDSSVDEATVEAPTPEQQQ